MCVPFSQESKEKQFHKNCKYGNYAAVRALIENGVHVNYSDIYGNSALHLAVLYNHINIIELLLQKGANVNKKNRYDRTPLHFAAFNMAINVVTLLLEYGASSSQQDIEGNTALMLAVLYNRKCLLLNDVCTQLLIATSCDEWKCLRNKNKENILDISKKENYKFLTQLLEKDLL
ncbi:ankyrin repeat domain-containing protein [Leptotrombidium deliense]|uniref:Ankyrin repeat domain-containing protein n=1 Tax=Leptotrombidium deliense TaxID=299467 RepID=A0A443SL55_9ACAR|nr:ankyrin repeat domain-containing protein [Leptotrombidium deliense]